MAYKNIDQINNFLERQKSNFESAKTKLERSCRIAATKPYAVYSLPEYGYRSATKIYCSANLDRALGKAVKLRLNAGNNDRVTYVLVEWDGEAMEWKEYKANGVGT